MESEPVTEVCIPTLKETIAELRSEKEIQTRAWRKMGNKTWWNGYKLDPPSLIAGAEGAFDSAISHLETMLEVWEKWYGKR